MNWRQFIALLGGAAVAWPLAARAQQNAIRRVGILLPAKADDAEFQARIAAFHRALEQSGWSVGRNVRIDTRWATANAAEIRRHAAELVALAPEVILADGDASVGPLLQVTRAVPIVFPVVTDPVGAAFGGLQSGSTSASASSAARYSLTARVRRSGSAHAISSGALP